MSKNQVDLTPVSMYEIIVKLMNALIGSIDKEYGEEGKELAKIGVESFIEEQRETVSMGVKSVVLKEEARFSYQGLFDAAEVEKTYQAYVDVQVEAGIENPVSIYGMMAKLFAHITKEVVDRYGKEAEDVIRRGVETFGVARGRHIARRAASAGKSNTIENYLPYYDMGRSDLFTYQTIYHKDEIEQSFTVCPFGDQWKEDGTGEYGILYCQMIDPSIAKGYNPNFEVVHDEYIIKEGCCHFLFQMKDEGDKKKSEG